MSRTRALTVTAAFALLPALLIGGCRAGEETPRPTAGPTLSQEGARPPQGTTWTADAPPAVIGADAMLASETAVERERQIAEREAAVAQREAGCASRGEHQRTAAVTTPRAQKRRAAIHVGRVPARRSGARSTETWTRREPHRRRPGVSRPRHGPLYNITAEGQRPPPRHRAGGRQLSSRVARKFYATACWRSPPPRVTGTVTRSGPASRRRRARIECASTVSNCPTAREPIYARVGGGRNENGPRPPHHGCSAGRAVLVAAQPRRRSASAPPGRRVEPSSARNA